MITTLSSPSFVNPAINHHRFLHSPQQTTIRRRKQSPSVQSSSFMTIFSKLEGNQRRRSAHYHPSIWETKHIESFGTPYTYELHGDRLEELKLVTKRSLRTAKDPSTIFNFIDSMQRLGVAYHFENDIKEAIYRVSNAVDETTTSSSCSLYITALKFRLLRQHGFSASSDVFQEFRGKEGRFKDSLRRDVQGLLSLYEASHFGVGGEEVLEGAKSFTIENLNSLMLTADSDLAKQLQQALEIPLRWRVPRMEARNFIDMYQKYETKNISLLELAKLDYNLVQSVYQQELKELARWWKDLGFKEELGFARDRLMENYLWAIGIVSEPKFSKCRVGLAKFVCILTAIDDMYDIYGSLDELERFTDAVYRWDMEAMTEIPQYMKICYLAMFNFGNELVYDVLKEHGLDVLRYIKQEWVNLCKSYLKEARWYNSGYKPTVDEYLENATTSVGGPAAMVHAYMLLGSSITETSLQHCFNINGSKLVHCSSLITRLCDDLGTCKVESSRGDVAKSIECYMAEKGLSEEEAEDEIKALISKSWKKLNEEAYLNNNSMLPKPYVNSCMNMARIAHFIFQHGDGIGTSNGVTKTRLASLIVKPIPINIIGM
ncbi:hypothetical protein FNV43_RR13446 [Rhamnella rubrinervis]|uniref:Uncharacterized protein n=1 Tax=Rhamnella rubrinervis TaxID=2594499 RepID=A0A8K0H126_9ROSA|nr:hypothetical protein FNV43_RR13446 [Rhamnella rubrinervis]